MLPKVNVSAGTSGPPTPAAVEGNYLFIGEAASGSGALKAIGPSSDLASLFTSGPLVDELTAFIATAGSGWTGSAWGYDNATAWADILVALESALEALSVPPEIIVLCEPIDAGAKLTELQTKAGTWLNIHKRTAILTRFRAIDNTPVTGDADWSEYTTAFDAVTTGVAAGRVAIIPTLFTKDLGAIAGAVARKKTYESPICPELGALSGLGDLPSDATGAPLDLAVLETLSASKASVVMWHEGLSGYYPAQVFPLAGAGDPERIERLQLSDYLARRVRLRGVMRLGKGVVDSPAGKAAYIQYISQPVRQAAGFEPPWIQPVSDGDFTVTFPTSTKAEIAFKYRDLKTGEEISVKLIAET
ncbi:MAG: DUF2586 domain-containing protein [Deltaproteobacteria bacterium]|nr:DUF2586 domain-containing protein [Deltaproteobacteria bacterium]